VLDKRANERQSSTLIDSKRRFRDRLEELVVKLTLDNAPELWSKYVLRSELAADVSVLITKSDSCAC
jgi:hypothetical protein